MRPMWVFALFGKNRFANFRREHHPRVECQIQIRHPLVDKRYKKSQGTPWDRRVSSQQIHHKVIQATVGIQGNAVGKVQIPDC